MHMLYIQKGQCHTLASMPLSCLRQEFQSGTQASVLGKHRCLGDPPSSGTHASVLDWRLPVDLRLSSSCIFGSVLNTFNSKKLPLFNCTMPLLHAQAAATLPHEESLNKQQHYDMEHSWWTSLIRRWVIPSGCLRLEQRRMHGR